MFFKMKQKDTAATFHTLLTLLHEPVCVCVWNKTITTDFLWLKSGFRESYVLEPEYKSPSRKHFAVVMTNLISETRWGVKDS